MNQQQTIGDRLREWRRSQKLTQAAAAEAVPISRNYLSMIERGEARNISHQVYKRIEAMIGSAPDGRSRYCLQTYDHKIYDGIVIRVTVEVLRENTDDE